MIKKKKSNGPWWKVVSFKEVWDISCRVTRFLLLLSFILLSINNICHIVPYFNIYRKKCIFVFLLSLMIINCRHFQALLLSIFPVCVSLPLGNFPSNVSEYYFFQCLLYSVIVISSAISILSTDWPLIVFTFTPHNVTLKLLFMLPACYILLLCSAWQYIFYDRLSFNC